MKEYRAGQPGVFLDTFTMPWYTQKKEMILLDIVITEEKNVTPEKCRNQEGSAKASTYSKRLLKILTFSHKLSCRTTLSFTSATRLVQKSFLI